MIVSSVALKKVQKKGIVNLSLCPMVQFGLFLFKFKQSFFTMALCFLNFSLGIFAAAPSLLKIDKDNKRLQGNIGKIYDDFLIYKNQR